MAKKNKQQGAPGNQQGVSKPESFTHGMVGDLDPHFQLEGSYSDAQNIRLTNAEGDTFTVENIEGNSLFVDLADYPIYASWVNSSGSLTSNSNYPTFYDRGPDAGSLTDNLKLDNRCSIVGHVSYADQLLLMIVGRFEYDRDGKTSSSDVLDYLQKDRTIFLMVDFDHEMQVTKVTDLRVCYNTSGLQYPDLNMDLDTPVRIEHLVENDSISRIYWTDNKNQLRTLNIKQKNLNEITKESLDISPLMNPSQPTLGATLNGSLPVGVYQYCFKYISENGGESTFSPLSNMYHVSDQAFGSSNLYGGGPKGNLGTQGFQIDVKDIDDKFKYIELYALLYDELNQAPRVSVVSRSQVSGTTQAIFQHTVWNNEIQNGLEEILIESNTFDVCKDIAIKDNILFAANLRQKRNFISEKEWNVKVMRWRIASGSSSQLDAMLTTNDPEVKHYKKDSSGNPVSINSSAFQYNVTDYTGDRCGYGQLLGSSGSMYEASSSTYDHLNYDGNINNPMWFTCLANQRQGQGGTGNRVNQYFQYRFLKDRMTLGAESYNYGGSTGNELGGCRITFGVEEKIADQSENAWNSPFISSTSKGDETATEFALTESYPLASGVHYTNPTGNTKFKTSMSLGGSKDPHLAGNKRGYQRADIYRFGVQTYDLNGSPGNVLWIGDIETPHQHDVLRMINYKHQYYFPGRDTIAMAFDKKHFISHEHCKDHRLSYVYGHVVPPVDVEWFTDRNTGNHVKSDQAYVRPDGNPIHADIRPGTTSDFTFDGRNKAVPAWDNASISSDAYGIDLSAFDNTHYLFDLYVAFEFTIPDEVCKKISGFRVVRAERTEEDRRMVQQGLLNQTAQYGSANNGQKYGYDKSRFCQKDNEAFGDDPIFVNQHVASGSGDATLPEQPEYNVYLNGYLGLAENSHMAFYDDSITNGKATEGGDLEGEVFYWPEREDSKKHLGSGSWRHARSKGGNAGSIGGPGTNGTHYRHSGYFGSYDKWGDSYSDGQETNYARNRTQISGSIFTLDAPDSAFGIRPYVYREGDFLRIDCSMKLTDEVRYNKQSGISWSSNLPHSHFSNCRRNSKSAVSGGEEAGWGAISSGTARAWKAVRTSDTLKNALSFATRKDIDNDYSVLVGKYYSYDPYFGIGMEIDGGKFAGSGRTTSGRPDRQYGWQLPIATSKEITDGEIIPSGFFKISKRIKAGRSHGFSNNTLGYVKLASQTSGSTAENGYYWVFGAVNSTLPWIENTSASSQKTEIKEATYNYDTVSTLQMGLRSILIEVDNRVTEVRKSGSGQLDNNWKYSSGYLPDSYNNWFAPLNLSALYEHSMWNGEGYENSSGQLNNDPTFRSGTLSHRNTGYGNAQDGSESHGSGPGASFFQKNKDLVPFKYLCSIVRNVIPYGGSTKGSISKTRYLPCGNFHPVAPDNPSSYNTQKHLSIVFGGDTFVNLYSHQKTSSPYMKKSASRWQVFPVESYVNTDMRSGLTLNSGDTVVGKKMNEPPFSNDWLYNSIYSQENNIKSGLMVDEALFDESLNLPYEIAYSNTKMLGQKSDAFRQFPINQFHDMEGLYGEINRIINFKNEIYVLQDSAFAKLLVNPLSMLSDDSGTSLFTGTGETVENHIYISTKYGSRHRFSVAMSEKSLFFVDSNFGRLFKYDTEKLISLGDALGQRNYLNNIIKEWEQRAYRDCISGDGPHNTLKGLLDSKAKPTGSRNYVADNPLSFLGITSIYDFKNKELLITFHNSFWDSKNNKRQRFARTIDNHSMGSTTGGEPVGISETLVYSEAINAFTSKYSVAPPQWLTGGHGSFILSPENEINVVSIANFNSGSGLNYPGSATYGSKYPYSLIGVTNTSYRNRRCNPLRLWIWDKHDKGKKTHFFNKKDDFIKSQTLTSPVDGTTISGHAVYHAGTKDVADESYIVKTINSEAASSKVFDNAKIIMTPKHVDFSFIDYTTDITHDTISVESDLDNIKRLIDDSEQLVINRRWDFDGTMDGWYFTSDAGGTFPTPIINNDSTITLEYTGDGRFRSNYKGEYLNIPGKYNNIIRMRVRRTLDGDNWTGSLFWRGYDPLRKEKGDYVTLVESSARHLAISEPEGIDDDFVIIEWDMSSVTSWDDCIIEQIRIDLSGNSGASTFDVDWIEIGGLQADKYVDGSLRIPLRTEKSTRRTRGTWAKIKYSAKTTEKFNIFAILAKYRKTY